MVKLEEVIDEEFTRSQEGPQEGDENDWDTDSDSDAESDISSVAPDESLYERLTALQDIVPASYRRGITSSVSKASSWVKSGLLMGGKTLWVVSTSALLLGVPWALAYAEEQQQMEMEREMKMQQSANELLAPGSTTQAQARPAL
ncbi:mitochondrial import translocase, subunit Tom22 [Lepidopterella palustris CBS 459.81]|uniref:Mitochondrial import translocase, subunit Tom22 n=1 Tax=Lepidopterella palustris CBS 459.81 TaxID=1314670 RepID=A0A8E2JKT1_9PEZI|nr:mitochondrial import translocase, subunit Tom22 [Lepidopterella palustris CBS 459.81]